MSRSQRKSPEEIQDADNDPDVSLRVILEAVPDGIVVADAETREFVYTNSALCRMLGYSREELLALTPLDIQPGESTGIVAARFAAAAADEIDTIRTLPILRKDGTTFVSDISVSRATVSGRECLIAVFRDATLRAKDELLQRDRQLAESEQRFHLMAANVKDYAIIFLDVDGRVVGWNAGAERCRGYKAGEIIGKHFSCLYSKQDIERGIPAIALETAARKGRFEQEEGERVRKDGTRFYANVVMTALRDEAGTLRGFCKVTRDITERKRAQQALCESQARLQLIFDSTSEMQVFYRIEPDGKCIVEALNRAANDNVATATGRNPAAFLGQDMAEMLKPMGFTAEHIEYRRRLLQKAAREKIVEQYATGLDNPRQEAVEASIFPALTQEGTCTHVLWTAKFVTAQYEANAELREREERLRVIFNAHRDLQSVIRVEPGGRFVSASFNQAHLDYAREFIPDPGQFLGREREELLRAAGIPENEIAEAAAQWREVAAIRTPARYELTWTIGPHARRETAEITIVPLPDSAGKCTRLLWTAHLMTERKRAEEALRRREQQFSVIVNASSDLQMLYRVLESGALVVDFVNQAWVDFFVGIAPSGVSVSDIVGLSDRELLELLKFPAERIAEVTALYRKVRDEKTPLCWETPSFAVVRHQTLEVLVQPVLDGAGHCTHVLWTGRNITERKRAEARIAGDRDRLRQILDSQFGFVAVVSPDGVIVEVNRTPLTLAGLERGDVLGQRFWEVGWLQPRTEPGVEEAIRRAALGEVVRVDIVGQFQAGGPRYVDAIFSPLRDAQGNVTEVIVFGVDVTGRKRAEELVRQNEARLREAQEIAQIGSWELDLIDSRLTWSDEVFRIFEIDKEVFGASYQAFLDLVHPEDRDAVDTAYRGSLETREPYEMTHRLMMPDGRIKYVFERGRSDFDADGRPLRSAGTVQDITEKMAAENRIKAQLREKEVLLREIHHRVKNNLQIVSGLLHLQSEAVRDPAVVELFEDSRRRVQAMASVHDILYQSADLGRVVVAPYIEKLVSALSATWARIGRDIQTVTEVSAPDLDLESAVPCGLIVSELISNAFKYAFEGRENGTIRITLRETAPGQLCLTVQDDGEGMPRSAGETTGGFGLRLVRLLADQISGRLEILFGRGTALSVTFPVRR